MLPGGSSQDGANIQQANYNGSSAQKIPGSFEMDKGIYQALETNV